MPRSGHLPYCRLLLRCATKTSASLSGEHRQIMASVGIRKLSKAIRHPDTNDRGDHRREDSEIQGPSTRRREYVQKGKLLARLDILQETSRDAASVMRSRP